MRVARRRRDQTERDRRQSLLKLQQRRGSWRCDQRGRWHRGNLRRWEPSRTVK